MKRWLIRIFLGVSGGRLLPLLLLTLVLLVSALTYVHQMRAIKAAVSLSEVARLRERLSVEQTRLDARMGNIEPVELQRMVSSLGLYDGLALAYLGGAEKTVQASLSRTDIGRPLAMVLQERAEAQPLRASLGEALPKAIDVQVVAEQALLTAVVPLHGGQWLKVLVDFGHPLAVRRAEVRALVVRNALLALLGAGGLAWLLHLMWFRRAQKLANALTAMGAGDLAVRTGLSGRDELALIGEAADHMAEQLQADRAQALRMTQLVERSPLVVIEWRNAPGWPVSYVSESVAQWGYAAADFERVEIRFTDLMHPEDVARINAEVAQFLESGPDEYRQLYRLRRASGEWVWVDDRTSVNRDAQGEVLSISAILLDITAQKEAEQAQREQGELLRMFYELPFLGMAISSPFDKRWMQVNDRLCEMLGYTREEMLAMSWAEMTPPGDREQNVALFDELMAGQRTGYRMSKRFVRKDGGTVHTEIDVRAVLGADGQPKKLFATIQDVTERQQAETAQRRSERDLREAQRIGRMGSWARDVDSDVAQWSEELYRIFDVDPETFSPSVSALLTLMHPEDRPLVTQAISAALAQGGHYESAFRIDTRSGTKYLRAKGELEMLGGRPVRLLGTVLDVTDITLAQRALEEKEALLAEAQAIAHIGNWTIDLLRDQATWSHELCRLLGFDPLTTQASLENFLQVVHPDDLEGVKAFSRQTIVSPSPDPQLHELRITAPGGVRELELRAHVSLGIDGRVVRLYGTAMDVTERRQAERASKDYKEMLEHAEALVKLGSWAGEFDSPKLTVSDQLYRNVGLDPLRREPTDAEYMARIHPDDRSVVAADMRCIRNGEAVGELVFRTDPVWGTMRWLRRTVRFIPREANGRGARFIGTLLDISDEVAAEDRLKRLNQELEQRVVERTEQLRQANQELEAFSYTVSHDLKAPLRGIDGYSQLLVEEYGPQLNEEGRGFVERIRQGVLQMGELIADLLAYSKIERRDMAQEPVALLPLAEQVVAGYQSDIDRHGATVRWAMEPLTLSLDREGMALVLRNLIGNALKFSRDREHPEIEIGARTEAGQRILWVRDNGVGFDMKYHDRIFGIFQRLHRAEEFPGTGVGLALVTKAVQRMGGRVWAESELGKGATFYLEFPQ